MTTPAGPGNKRLRFGQLAGDGAQISGLVGADPAKEYGSMEAIALNLIDLDPANVRQLKLDKADPRNIPEDHPDAAQMHAEFEALQELAASIHKIGLQQAVGIYRSGSRFRLVWGERRFLAHRLLGLEYIKANIIRQPPASQVAAQLAENMFREDLSLAERATAFDRLINESLQTEQPIRTVDDLVLATGLGNTAASRYLAIYRAPPDVRQAIADGRVSSAKQAYALIQIADPVERQRLMSLNDSSPTPTTDRSADKPSQEVTRRTPVRRQGKPKTQIKIALKSPRSGEIVRTIAERLLPKQEYSAFAKVDWTDLTSVQDVFEQIIRRIERELERSKGKAP